MYKAVLVHEIVPGKLAEFKRWFQDADRERKARNPDYTPFRRYITVIGSLTRVYIEIEYETWPQRPIVWAEGVEDDFKNLVVAGQSEMYILKELETEN
jgi:hypothetical protein